MNISSTIATEFNFMPKKKNPTNQIYCTNVFRKGKQTKEEN